MQQCCCRADVWEAASELMTHLHTFSFGIDLSLSLSLYLYISPYLSLSHCIQTCGARTCTWEWAGPSQDGCDWSVDANTGRQVKEKAGGQKVCGLPPSWNV